METGNNNLAINFVIEPIPELNHKQLSREEIFTIKMDYLQKAEGSIFAVIKHLASENIHNQLDFSYEIESLAEIGDAISKSALTEIENHHCLDVNKLSDYADSSQKAKLVS